MFAYYFNSCPTCKNYERNLVREAVLRAESLSQSSIALAERYIAILPQVWGEEASAICQEQGVVLPFLYNLETKEALHIDHMQGDMAQKIDNFLTPKSADE